MDENPVEETLFNPHLLSPARVMQLQRLMGNTAVRSLLTHKQPQKRPVQTVSKQSIQAFRLPNGYTFKSGHTSQPTSMELQKIGGANKKHHIIPDSVILKYLDEQHKAGKLDDLDDWAITAMQNEIARLQVFKKKLDAYLVLDDVLYQCRDGSVKIDTLAGALSAFVNAYEGQPKPAAFAPFEKAHQLVVGYLKCRSYPVATLRNLNGWPQKNEFTTLLGIAKVEDLSEEDRQGGGGLSKNIAATIEKGFPALNAEEYEIFSTNPDTIRRLGGSISERDVVLGKLKTQAQMDKTEVDNILIPTLTWLPANLMIGTGNRKWEPGDDLDVEVLAKHSDTQSAALITRLSLLLKDDKGKKLIDKDDPEHTAMTTRILEELEHDFGSNIPALLKQLSNQPATVNQALETGPKETDKGEWKKQEKKAIEHAEGGLDYDEHRYDDLHAPDFSIMGIIKSLIGIE